MQQVNAPPFGMGGQPRPGSMPMTGALSQPPSLNQTAAPMSSTFGGNPSMQGAQQLKAPLSMPPAMNNLAGARPPASMASSMQSSMPASSLSAPRSLQGMPAGREPALAPGQGMQQHGAGAAPTAFQPGFGSMAPRPAAPVLSQPPSMGGAPRPSTGGLGTAAMGGGALGAVQGTSAGASALQGQPGPVLAPRPLSGAFGPGHGGGPSATGSQSGNGPSTGPTPAPGGLAAAGYVGQAGGLGSGAPRPALAAAAPPASSGALLRPPTLPGASSGGPSGGATAGPGGAGAVPAQHNSAGAALPMGAARAGLGAGMMPAGAPAPASAASMFGAPRPMGNTSTGGQGVPSAAGAASAAGGMPTGQLSGAPQMNKPASALQGPPGAPTLGGGGVVPQPAGQAPLPAGGLQQPRTTMPTSLQGPPSLSSHAPAAGPASQQVPQQPGAMQSQQQQGPPGQQGPQGPQGQAQGWPTGMSGPPSSRPALSSGPHTGPGLGGQPPSTSHPQAQAVQGPGGPGVRGQPHSLHQQGGMPGLQQQQQQHAQPQHGPPSMVGGLQAQGGPLQQPLAGGGPPTSLRQGPPAMPPGMPPQQQQLQQGPPQQAGGPPMGMYGQAPAQQQPQPQLQAGGPPPSGAYGQQHQYQQGPPQQQQQYGQQPQQQQYGQQLQQQQYGQQQQQQGGPPGGYGGPMMGGHAAPPAPIPAAPARPAAPAAPRIDPTNIPRPRYTHPSRPVRYGTNDSSMNVPPHAWSDYVVEDQGNATPRAMRATLGYVPINKDILKDTKLPLALAITPLAQPHTWRGEAPVQCVDFGPEGPVRCTRCRGYINCHARWIDGGRNWLCPLCGESNEAPGWYQQPLDQYGLRIDRGTRPELSYGTVEFVAPASYLREDETGHKRQPAPLAVAFLVDVSLPAILSGLLSSSLFAVSSALEALESQGEGKARAGIIAYDGQLHYYDMSPNRREPCEVLAGDVEDSFCPLALDQWCPTVSGNKARLQSLLDRLPSLFPPTIARHAQSAGLAALKSAIDGLSYTGGRVVCFLSQLPMIGEGKLGSRELPKYYGSEGEKVMLVPPTSGSPSATWVAELTKTAAGHGVSVDLLVCTSNSVDLGILGQLSYTTGGEVRQYPAFAAPLGISPPASGAPLQVPEVQQDVTQKLAQELAASLSREIGTEAVLKIRASKGLSVNRYMGNFNERAESEADLAGIDSEKTLVVCLTHDGNEIRDAEGLHLQAALLYTSAAGSRRVRVHTLRLTASESIHDIFRHTDIDAVMAYLIRKSVQTVLTKEVRFVAPDLTESAIDMLFAYRKYCAAHSSAGQLILPESMKLLPLYLSVVNKLGAFVVNRPAPKAVQGRNPYSEVTVRADPRLVELIYLSAQPLASIVPYMYCRMYRLDTCAPCHGVPLDPEEDPESPSTRPQSHTTLTYEQLQRVLLPQVVYPSVEQVAKHGVYMLESRDGVFVYIGPEADERTVSELVGEGVVRQLPIALPPGMQLPVLNTDLSKQVWTMIAAVRSRRAPYLPVILVTEGDPQAKEAFLGLMVEDQVGQAKSYVDLLCHVHTSIQAKMAAQS